MFKRLSVHPAQVDSYQRQSIIVLDESRLGLALPSLIRLASGELMNRFNAHSVSHWAFNFFMLSDGGPLVVKAHQQLFFAVFVLIFEFHLIIHFNINCLLKVSNQRHP